MASLAVLLLCRGCKRAIEGAKCVDVKQRPVDLGRLPVPAKTEHGQERQPGPFEDRHGQLKRSVDIDPRTSDMAAQTASPGSPVLRIKDETPQSDKRYPCGPFARCTSRRSSWVRKNDRSTSREAIAVDIETATMAANPVCQSPVSSNTISVVEIGAPRTAAATAPIPASAYSVSDPDTFGKVAVAVSPKASPSKAPTMIDGENMGAYVPKLTDARQATASGPAPLNGTSARTMPAGAGIMRGKGFCIEE